MRRPARLEHWLPTQIKQPSFFDSICNRSTRYLTAFGITNQNGEQRWISGAHDQKDHVRSRHLRTETKSKPSQKLFLTADRISGEEPFFSLKETTLVTSAMTVQAVVRDVSHMQTGLWLWLFQQNGTFMRGISCVSTAFFGILINAMCHS